MRAMCKKIAESEDFHRLVFFLILVSALILGLDAAPDFSAGYDDALSWAELFIQAAFVFEISLRIAAAEPHPGAFFRSRWNIFDFTVVAVSLLPAVGAFALVARLLRLLRLLRFFSVSERLRRFIARLHDAFEEVLSAGAIGLVLGYIFVIAGYYLFGVWDPAHWGGLRQALLSVFYLALFQNVSAYVEPLAAHSLSCLLYFIAFYATLLGLALGVVVASVLQGHEREK
jgi:voltage-gated sodium channel